MHMKRRGFLSSPLGLAAAATDDTRIYAYGDGTPLSPAAYSSLLQQLAPKIKPDDYSRLGVVEELEQRMAALLGKEAAVWLPTGTLANHLAVRLLAQPGRRVLVQEQSHLYNDSGDCAQTLSGLTLVPLGTGRAAFSLDEAEAAAHGAALGRVVTPVSALIHAATMVTAGVYMVARSTPLFARKLRQHKWSSAASEPSPPCSPH